MEPSEKPRQMQFSEASHSFANLSQSQAKTREPTTNVTSGPKRSTPFANYDQDTHSWRTYQISLLTSTLEPYSQTWPQSGSMQSGTVSARQKSERHTEGNGSLSWLTPDTQNNRDGGILRKAAVLETNHAVSLHHQASHWPTPKARDYRTVSGNEHRDSPDLNIVSASGPQAQTTSNDGHDCSPKCRRLNPRFVEWLMGFQIGHTNLKPLGTQ